MLPWDGGTQWLGAVVVLGPVASGLRPKFRCWDLVLCPCSSTFLSVCVSRSEKRHGMGVSGEVPPGLPTPKRIAVLKVRL